MILQLIRHEWRQWFRNTQMTWVTVALFVISTIALVVQTSYYSELLTRRSEAQAASRKAWLTQGEKHPHMAAHFGNYAYKQPAAFYCFDAGVTPFTGSAVYLEPHRQNDFLLSKGQESDTGARFGWLAPALVCQLLIPLLVILFTFNSITAEKKQGTYALLLVQGLTVRQLIFGKVAAAWLLFSLYFTVYLLGTAMSAWWVLQQPVSASLAVFGFLWLTYILYYAIWSLLGVVVSAVARNTGQAIALLLLLWIATSIILPKAGANIAAKTWPIGSNYTFKKQIAYDIENGLTGHDSRSSRARRIADSLLKAHRADSLQHLPFNFEGYIMQQGEAYSSKVYDVHFQKIFLALRQQGNFQSWLSIASPFTAVSNISMAACNSSIEAEIDFQQQAEQYRRSFVQQMNEDMMYNSAYGDWEHYKVREQQYRQTNDFTATQQPLRWRLRFAAKDMLCLCIWLSALVLALFYISKNKPHAA
jgi:ABC-2 type transport system permease protein